MWTYSIDNTKPERILTKPAFKRAMPSPFLSETVVGAATGGGQAADITGNSPVTYELLSQDDFLREFDVNGHKINSAKYWPDLIELNTPSKVSRKVKSRVAVGWQERIHTKRLTALCGNNVNHRLIRGYGAESRELDYLSMFREGWEEKNMEIAVYGFISADGKTGDSAVVFWKSNYRMGWRQMSYDKGDILYPHYDPISGRLALFGRKYTSTGDDGKERTYLDVWDNTYYIRYVMDSDGSPRGVWKVDVSKAPHGYSRIPVVYHRYGSPFWAPSQSLIENYEMSVSQFAENNSVYALRILYSLGQSMNVKSTVDGTPVRIDSPDPNAKVGYLEPADASSSFTEQLNILERNIMRSSFAVETPELKSGSDLSSLTVKMMFADAYLKALQDSQEYQESLDDITALFREGYGTESGRITDFSNMRIKSELSPFIFMSEGELINAITQLVGIGVMSRQTGAEIAYNAGYGTADEWSRRLKEDHDALIGVKVESTKQNGDIIAEARENGQ